MENENKEYLKFAKEIAYETGKVHDEVIGMIKKYLILN